MVKKVATLAQLEQQKRNFIQAYKQGKISSAEYNKAMAYTQAEINRKRAEQLKQKQTPTPPLPSTKFVEGNWQPVTVETAKSEEQRQLLIESQRKAEAADFYSSIGRFDLAAKGYSAPEQKIPEGYEIAEVTEKPYITKDVEGQLVRTTALEITYKEKSKPLGFGEMAYVSTKVAEDVLFVVTGQQKSGVGKALVRAQMSPLYFAAGEVGTLEADVVGLASVPTSIYESARTGKLQYKQAVDIKLSPTVIGSLTGSVFGSPAEASEFTSRPLAYRTGAAFGEAAFLTVSSEVTGKIVQKVFAPSVEKSLFGSYRKSVEAGKLWSPSKVQKVATKLTGARMPRLAGQIVSMPKDVGLDVFEFAVSPRSSALFTPLPREPTFASQLVSVPFGVKTMVTGAGKTVEFVSKQMMEAQDVAWELMQTPKSSGVMLWKETIKKTNTSYLHLISRKGYTTIGTFGWEKPFSSGFLSAPAQVAVSTTTKVTTGKKSMPYTPSTIEKTVTKATRNIPYTPTLADPLGVASGIGIPTLTPKRVTRKERIVVSVFTTPHLFPDITSDTKQEKMAVPIVGELTSQRQEQKQVVTPILNIPTPEIPTPDFPPQPKPTPPFTPNIPTPVVPKIPKTPYFPRAGGDTSTRSFDRLIGKWTPRKHKVKTWDQMLKTFGFGKAASKIPRSIKRISRMEVPSFGKVKRTRKIIKKKRKNKTRRKRR